MNRLVTFFVCALLSAPVIHAEAPIGAPSIVPHPLESYLPITPDKNACIMCHQAQTTPERIKGQIPKSHFKADGKLSGSRWDCLMCHGRQSSAAELAPVDPNELVR